ncbi:hypothetical protein LBMAG20_16530 [Methylocystaceae bacterium]|nr:hypothetical protein LBMAG20_16530 [Methylocystaceae bacterium]
MALSWELLHFQKVQIQKFIKMELSRDRLLINSLFDSDRRNEREYGFQVYKIVIDTDTEHLGVIFSLSKID